MSGRRRTGALAGALDLSAKLYLHREEQAQKRRERAEALALKFKAELALEQAKRGMAYTDPFTQQAVPSATEASLPQTPFVAGPGGSFITSDSPNAEVAPGFEVPRAAVASALDRGAYAPPTGLESSGFAYTDPRGIRRSFARPNTGSSTGLPELEAELRNEETPDAGEASSEQSADSATGFILPPGISYGPTSKSRTQPPASSRTTDIASLVQDAQAAQAEGFSAEEVAEQLRQLGVDEADIKDILLDAGF